MSPLSLSIQTVRDTADTVAESHIKVLAQLLNVANLVSLTNSNPSHIKMSLASLNAIYE